MEMSIGRSLKTTGALGTPEEFKWNIEPDQQIAPSAPIKKRKIKILIVDDDETIRHIMAKYLILIGFDVVEANNGHEGQYIFLETNFDLVITDLEMPGMDGWALAFLIKKEAPHIPVIMVTGLDEERFMQNIKENCIDIVMFKPFRMKELGENIKRMLGPLC